MKDRLIELLKNKYDHFCDQCRVNKDSHYIENLADHLIQNGVIVPPCNLGDTVYCLKFKRDKESYPIKTVPNGYLEETVVGIHICDDRLKKNAVSNKKYKDYLITQVGCHNAFRHIPMNKIGKTVFLSKEDVEKALRDGEIDV